MSDDNTEERGTVYDGTRNRLYRTVKAIRVIAGEVFLLVCLFAGIVGLGLIIARALTR